MTKSKQRFRQPESFKNLDWDPDEIPGLSSFIYSENRFREPHEYSNYYEVQARRGKQLERLGIHRNADFEEVLIELEDAKKEFNNITEEYDLLEAKVEKQDLETSTLQERVTELQDELDRAHVVGCETMQELQKYGAHADECNIWDIQAAGRKAKKSSCTCGWTQILEKTTK